MAASTATAISTIQPRMLVTRRIAAGVGTNRERWAGWVESVTEQTDRSGYVNRTAWVVDREWKDIHGTWHPLPDAAVRVGNLRSIGGGELFGRIG